MNGVVLAATPDVADRLRANMATSRSTLPRSRPVATGLRSSGSSAASVDGVRSREAAYAAWDVLCPRPASGSDSRPLTDRS
jgi:hypothetical protein